MIKKNIKSMIIIFSALIIISANQLRTILTHGGTVSFRSQWELTLNVTLRLILDSFFKSFHAQGPTCMTHLKHIIKTNRVYIFYKLN